MGRIYIMKEYLKKMDQWMDKLISSYPLWSFIICNKLLWFVGFTYSVFAIQGTVPTLRQFVLGAIFALLTSPLGYYMFKKFGGQK